MTFSHFFTVNDVPNTSEATTESKADFYGVENRNERSAVVQNSGGVALPIARRPVSRNRRNVI